MPITTSEAPSASSTLTPVEVAGALGVTPTTVRRWLAEGRLEGVRVGGRLRVSREAVYRCVRPAGHHEEETR